jgi:hypothetical protein
MPTTLTQFSGLDNQHRPETLEPGTLSNCNNVIVDDRKRLETRFGYWNYNSSLNIGEVTDRFNMPQEKWSYYLAEGSLYCWDEHSMRTAATGLTDTRLHHAAIGNNFLYGGNTDAGWIRDGIIRQPLRVPMPSFPTVQVVAGDLPPGQYQIATVLRRYGEVSALASPTHPSLSVFIPDGSTGAISITPNPPTGYCADIYVTEANSKAEAFFATSYGSEVIYNGQELLDKLDDWHIGTKPLPSRPIIGMAMYDLRLHVAFYNADFDTTQYYRSVQGRWHLYRLNEDYYSRAGKCLQMWGVDEGVLVATTQEVFLWREDGTGAGSPLNLCRWGCSEDRPIDKDTTGKLCINTNQCLATYPPFDISTRFQFIPPKATSANVAMIQQNGLHVGLVNADEEGQPFTNYEL